MNKYTVGKATQGLANYIIRNDGQSRGVAIAYDSRNMSEEFSKQVALILNANGIKTYRFEKLRPTPELSFAVRTLNCISGIVITASHNPPNYNGYKVYWEDGGQISNPIDEEITQEVQSITDFETIKTMSEEEAIKEGLYNEIGKEIDDLYINTLKNNSLNSKNIKEQVKELKIVYTPLHGTGGMLAKRVLQETGFEKIYIVPEQEKPDGNFPTVSYPNPEDPKAFELALKLAEEVNADIVIANDPDADRIGLHVKDTATGEYILFNGNMIGLIIAEYLISQKKEKNMLANNSALIKTIVSSNMTDQICKYYGIELFQTLTGFKNIAAMIKKFELEDTYETVMGFEESYGCLIGTYVRDKDGIIVAMLLCEAAAFYKGQGLTLWDKMKQMYERYGYYKEGQVVINFDAGAIGAEKMKSTMQNLRENPLQNIGKYKILKSRDYSNGEVRDNILNATTKENLPKSNVLYYELENDFWCAVRPSGTEPKIKFYMGVKGVSLDDAKEKLQDSLENIKKLIV